VTRHRQVRSYPRTARVNEVVREVLADELERLSDPRLGLVTLTDVEVSADLRHADVYYSVWEAPGGPPPAGSAPRAGPGEHRTAGRAAEARGRAGPASRERSGGRTAAGAPSGHVPGPEETAAALRSAAPHLRAVLGRQVRLKYLPELNFVVDPSTEAGRRIDEILAGLRRDDARVEPGAGSSEGAGS